MVPPKSVMSGKMYRELDLGPLNETSLPSVVGANGSSLGVGDAYNVKWVLERKLLTKHS